MSSFPVFLSKINTIAGWVANLRNIDPITLCEALLSCAAEIDDPLSTNVCASGRARLVRTIVLLKQ